MADDSYFSFLPLAHVYDQIIETYCISRGSSIGFWQGVSLRFSSLYLILPFCRVQFGLWKLQSRIISNSHFRASYWQDVRYLMEDIVELKPTIFSGVPRIYDRIYTGTYRVIVAIKENLCSVLLSNDVDNDLCMKVSWVKFHREGHWRRHCSSMHIISTCCCTTFLMPSSLYLHFSNTK